MFYYSDVYQLVLLWKNIFTNERLVEIAINYEVFILT